LAATYAAPTLVVVPPTDSENYHFENIMDRMREKTGVRAPSVCDAPMPAEDIMAVIARKREAAAGE
jgi:hypothetical protein